MPEFSFYKLKVVLLESWKQLKYRFLYQFLKLCPSYVAYHKIKDWATTKCKRGNFFFANNQ